MSIAVGILPPYRANVASDPEWMTDFARHAEACGFESIYVVEHVVVPVGHAERYPYSETGRMPLPDDCELPDPLELLAFLAARTDRIVLATGILVAPHHHPLVLAKRLATLDVLSAGRVRLGVGVGWMREELEATGIDFSSRGRRLDEIIEVLRKVWAQDEPSHHGEFFSFQRARSHPKPVRSSGIPIHVGGHSMAAARRAGRHGDGFQPIGIDGETLGLRLDTMRRAAADAGRDPAALEITLGGSLSSLTPERADELAAIGATRVLVSTATADLSEVRDEMSALSERLSLTFR